MKNRQSGRIGAFGVIALVVVGVLAMLAAIYGPRLVREGRAVGVPLLRMARSEKALDALDTTYAFEPPADGRINPDRLEAFLEIREDLKPRYAEWTDVVEQQTAEHGESWVAAREVIKATSDVIAAQIRDLTAHHMSPNEFRWLEKTVYRDWLDSADQDNETTRTLRKATEDDLAFVIGLEHSRGRSAGLAAVRSRLEERLDTLGSAENTATGPNTDLLEANRTRIAGLRLKGYAEIHGTLSSSRKGHRGVTVTFPSTEKQTPEREPR